MKELTQEQKEQFDRWHDSGKMPDWVYYQQVNVPWYISVPAQIDKFKKEADERQAKIQEEKERQRQAQEQKKQEAEQEKALYEDASKIAVKAFEDVFKGYSKG